jgi:alpha-beta hydrolase superfamily lysophospholipase
MDRVYCPNLRRWSAAIQALLAIVLVSSSLAQSPARRSDARRYLPITRFYEISQPLPPGKPGDLIRSQPFSNYDLPLEVSATRIVYRSRSANGDDIAASGVVLTPLGKPPTGGWPVIAWAHGFAGITRQCAPSLMRNLEHGPFLSMYVKLGYAVVATDYAGLGTVGRTAFLDSNSNAADMLYAVAAAHAAVPQLGSRWIALGEAEGALAAAALAELQSSTRDPNYLGGIAISGLADLHDIYERAAANSPGKFAPLAHGVKALYPLFRPDSILTPAGMALYDQLESTCSPSAEPAVTPSQIVKPSWKNDSFLKQFFDRNSRGQKSAHGPLLVIAGEADTRVLPSMTAQTIARMCKHGDQIEFDKYPNVDGGQVLGESTRDQITWIQARFAGIKAPSNCP